MSDSFDPYHRWLGISPKHQPPNHYRLLAIERLEDDAEVIRDAAERQMSHVRRYELGQHAQLAQQILNELARAKACLLDHPAKASYDQQLESTGSDDDASEPSVPDQVVDDAAEQENQDLGISQPITSIDIDPFRATSESEVPSSSKRGRVTSRRVGPKRQTGDGPPGFPSITPVRSGESAAAESSTNQQLGRLLESIKQDASQQIPSPSIGTANPTTSVLRRVRRSKSPISKNGVVVAVLSIGAVLLVIVLGVVLSQPADQRRGDSQGENTSGEFARLNALKRRDDEQLFAQNYSGETKTILLTTLKPIHTKVGFGQFGINSSHGVSSGPIYEGRKYDNYLFMHANAEAVFDLPENAVSFRCVVYLGANGESGVIYRIYADDQKILDSGVVQGHQGKELWSWIPRGAKLLRIVVDTNGNGIADHSFVLEPSLEVATTHTSNGPAR